MTEISAICEPSIQAKKRGRPKKPENEKFNYPEARRKYKQKIRDQQGGQLYNEKQREANKRWRDKIKAICGRVPSYNNPVNLKTLLAQNKNV